MENTEVVNTASKYIVKSTGIGSETNLGKWLVDAEELTGIGVIFDQDMSNIPEVEAGMRTSKKGAVTYANYQESRLRHYHQTIDKYIAKGPLKF